MDIEQTRRSASPFNEASHLNELPAFAMGHRRISDSLKQVQALRDRAKELMRSNVPELLHVATPELQEGAIEVFPHLRANLLADMTQVVPGHRKARHNRTGIGCVESHCLGDLVGIVSCYG